MSTNTASVVSHFPKPQNGFTTTTSGSVASGAATVGLNSVAGYSNGDIAVFVIDPTDAAKKQTFTGVIDTSGVQVTSVVWTAGTNQTHALGATIVDYATATHIAMMSKGILVSHNQDGTIKANAITAASQITDGIIGDAEMAVAVKPVTLFNENTFDHVVSGCVWTADAAGSTKAASMTSGVAMIAGKRVTVAAVTARTFTASKDVYVGLTDAGDGTATIVYYDNTTNAASPSLVTAAYTMVIAIVVVGATNIAAAASINQGQEDRVLPIASSTAYAGTDSLGNLICPRDPNRKVLGHRQSISAFSTASQTAGTAVTGVSCPVIVPTNPRKIKVSVSADYMTQNGGAATATFLGIYEGATELKRQTVSSPGANYATPANTWVEFTPTAGLHTYIAAFWVGGSTGTLNATSTAPIELIVELV